MVQFITLILVAILVEGVVTYINTFFVKGKFQWQMLVGLTLGIAVSLIYRVDVFAMLNISTSIPFIGAVLTGILVSRGSNYIFDLVKALQGATGKTATVTAESILKSAAPLLGAVQDVVDDIKPKTEEAVTTNTAANPPSDIIVK